MLNNMRNHVARGTRIQPGRNGSETTTDKGAPNNSSATTAKYTPSARRQAPLSHGLAETGVRMEIMEEYKKVLWNYSGSSDEIFSHGWHYLVGIASPTSRSWNTFFRARIPAV